jgi:hypothetical protein
LQAAIRTGDSAEALLAALGLPRRSPPVGFDLVALLEEARHEADLLGHLYLDADHLPLARTKCPLPG